MTGPPQGEGYRHDDTPSGGLSRWEWLSLVAPLLLAALVHSPSLHLGFAGDDFQWWQHARMALEKPSLLLAPYASFRPTNTWSLAANHLVFGTEPCGYHATNLLLHLGCGAFLWFLARRLGLSAPARAAVVLLWTCSPFSLEPMQWVNTRYNLVLLMLWLGLALVWPGPQVDWACRRVTTVIALVALSALTSETWVVLPGLVVCFELLLARTSLRRAIVAGTLCGLAVAVYVTVYFAHPPIRPEAYYAAGWSAAAKLPHAWAAMSYLTTMRPLAFPIGTPEVIALLSMAGLAWLAWRRRCAVIVFGLTLFVLPFVPVLPVGFMTTRYTTIPLAGFLLAVAGGAAEGRAALSPLLRRFGAAVTMALVLLAFAANLAWLRADLEDARAYSRANARLVAEARELAPRLRPNEPIVAVRHERVNLPAHLAPASVGVPKLYYPRHGDPYSLADWGAVLTYALDPLDGPILVKVAPETQDVTPYQVVAHTDGKLEMMPASAATAMSAALHWQDLGFPVCVLVPWPAQAAKVTGG